MSSSSELPIGAFVRRTGLPEATLRMWERRYGFPQPLRTQTGHRRYSEADVEAIRTVLAARESGLSLPAAIARTRRARAPQQFSAFATLREYSPDLQTLTLDKPTLLALSHAIEDEVLSRADRRLLFGCFQRERFYRIERTRWRELSDVAVSAVFADFTSPTDPDDGPAEIPIAAIRPLAREWSIVSYGERSAVCMAGRELATSNPDSEPGQRLFETVWTVEPGAVRKLAQTCADAAATAVPAVADRAEELLALAPTAGPEAQLRLAKAIFDRVLLSWR